MSENSPAVEMHNICKRFGPVVANNGVNFTLRKGEIHALLGENGAGKSTLMRILYGLYQPDSGKICIHGQPTPIQSPKVAIAHGIGMVTQHFALAEPLTVTENIILGYTKNFTLNLSDSQRSVTHLAEHFGVAIDPAARVRDLSVGQRQRVEILKALYRKAEVLILDEPTAVLAPQEVEQLFWGLKRLQVTGLSVIFISHKLHEVMSITDQITVLRGGEVAGTVATSETTPAALAQMMVGRVTVPAAKSSQAAAQPVRLQVRNLSARDNKGLPALKEISFEIAAGEILGVAGVAGNGQVELAQVLEGTRRASRGQVLLQGQDVTNTHPTALMAAGIGRISEERQNSVVGDLTVAQNMALEHLAEFSRHGILDQQRMIEHAQQLIGEYQIKASPHDKIRTLSGGNMQKVILARVIERNPKVLIVSQPTRGLDVGATEYIHRKLLEQRQKGAAILLISEDLDEILQLADRVAVLYEGAIIDMLPASKATTERIGLLMAGVKRK